MKKRAKRTRETDEMAAFCRRIIKAVGKRAAHDIDGLADLAQLRGALDLALADAVRELRGTYSDTDIALQFNCTRQAVGLRWPRSRQV